MSHPSVARIVSEEEIVGEEGEALMAQVVSVNSIFAAAYLHSIVDRWHWLPGMLALPTHDAPWWWNDTSGENQGL